MTGANVNTNAVHRLVLDQEDSAGTHCGLRQIANETNIATTVSAPNHSQGSETPILQEANRPHGLK